MIFLFKPNRKLIEVNDMAYRLTVFIDIILIIHFSTEILISITSVNNFKY